jgi:hypothetical protein
MRKPQPPPTDPIEPGRLVTYRDWDGRLCGWNVDPWPHLEACTVRRCTWDAGYWQVDLLDGSSIGLRAILAVAEIDRAGLVCAHWTTQELWQEDECAR